MSPPDAWQISGVKHNRRSPKLHAICASTVALKNRAKILHRTAQGWGERGVDHNKLLADVGDVHQSDGEGDRKHRAMSGKETPMALICPLTDRDIRFLRLKARHRPSTSCY